MITRSSIKITLIVNIKATHSIGVSNIITFNLMDMEKYNNICPTSLNNKTKIINHKSHYKS